MRLLLTTLCALAFLILAPASASAEFLRIEIKILGMD
jgi:hypothetical protein